MFCVWAFCHTTDINTTVWFCPNRPEHILVNTCNTCCDVKGTDMVLTSRKNAWKQIFIFPLRYYANCVSTALTVLITKVSTSFIVTLYSKVHLLVLTQCAVNCKLHKMYSMRVTTCHESDDMPWEWWHTMRENDMPWEWWHTMKVTTCHESDDTLWKWWHTMKVMTLWKWSHTMKVMTHHESDDTPWKWWHYESDHTPWKWWHTMKVMRHHESDDTPWEWWHAMKVMTRHESDDMLWVTTHHESDYTPYCLKHL
jgi:hypothetical protein